MALDIQTSKNDVSPSRPGRTLLSHNQKWALGFLAVAVFVFILYQFVIPNLNDAGQSFFQDWIPLSSVNECLVWVICALGLNVVVGYAGLLDLGFVAFWAIGGYTAGWLMSTFFSQWSVNVLGSVAPGSPRRPRSRGPAGRRSRRRR